MDHAKKLIFIEPRVLEQLQTHREYKELEKPAYKKTKTGASMEMKKILQEDNSDGVPDDVKAKLYQQALTHFLNLKNRLPFQEKVKVNRLTPAPAPTPLQLPQAALLTSPTAAPRPKKARTRKTPPSLKSPFIRWDQFVSRKKK